MAVMSDAPSLSRGEPGGHHLAPPVVATSTIVLAYYSWDEDLCHISRLAWPKCPQSCLSSFLVTQAAGGIHEGSDLVESFDVVHNGIVVEGRYPINPLVV